MRDPCKNLKDCFEHVVRIFFLFIARSFGNAFTSLMFVALIFYIISFISPDWYRWASKWANQPLLPIANNCNIMETNIPSNISKIKVYKIVISFDSVIKQSQQILVYDPNGHIEIQNDKDTRRIYKFINGSGKKHITFNVLSEDLPIGEVDYESCPFKIQYIRD